MKTSNEVIGDWIQALQAEHVKVGLHELTPQERDLCIQLLQAVGGDLAMLEPQCEASRR